MSKAAKITLGIVGGFVAFIVLIVSLAFVATAGPVKSADGFFSLLRDGDTEAAYRSTAKDFQSTVSYEEFEAFLDDYPKFKDNRSASYRSREISNDVGTLKGDLTADDGGVTPIEIGLVRENGEWRILYIRETVDSGIETVD
ncbi:DUF4864 domain-containing protein [Candidatus Uhrbacteria bacterium]|nr:DUF4864 domain-containing protein [Candidatus Uhrbacteria bacterium]